MRQINTRAIKRQCFVPGCRNLQTFMVYRTVEPWAKVVICEECARELYETFVPNIDEKEEQKVENAPEKVQKVEETPENVPDEVQKTVKVTERKTTTRKSAAK